MFSFNVGSVPYFADVFTAWVMDNAMPSSMKSRFPDLAFATSAAYYEQGVPLVGEFIESWDHIEEFYRRWPTPWSERVRTLLRGMRAKGYDSKFRAGQSLYTLILSRSRRHGLRRDQVSLAFSFGENDRMNVTLDDTVGSRSRNLPIDVTADLEDLLAELERQQID